MPSKLISARGLSKEGMDFYDKLLGDTTWHLTLDLKLIVLKIWKNIVDFPLTPPLTSPKQWYFPHHHCFQTFYFVLFFLPDFTRGTGVGGW